MNEWAMGGGMMGGWVMDGGALGGWVMGQVLGGIIGPGGIQLGAGGCSCCAGNKALIKVPISCITI